MIINIEKKQIRGFKVFKFENDLDNSKIKTENFIYIDEDEKEHYLTSKIDNKNTCSSCFFYNDNTVCSDICPCNRLDIDNNYVYSEINCYEALFGGK